MIRARRGTVLIVLAIACVLGMLFTAPTSTDPDAYGPQRAEDLPQLMGALAANAGPDRSVLEGQSFSLLARATLDVNWTSLWADDFESYSAGALSSPWVDESTGANFAEISSTVAHSGTQAVRIVDTSPILGATAARAISGTVFELTTWAYAIPTDGFFTPMLSSGGTGSDWEGVRAGMGPDGAFVYGQCGPGWTTSSTNYTAATWYEIRLVADIVADSYAMYVNGTLLASGVPVCGSATSFSHVRQTSAGDYVGEFFVDDVTLREGQPIPIVEYAWDLDGRVDADGDGNATNDRDRVGRTADAVYGDDGEYLVTLTVTDAFGSQANDTALVTVRNEAPSVALDVDEPPAASDGTTLRMRATDSGSDDLTFSWEWSDGVSGSETVWNGVLPDPPHSPDGTFPVSAWFNVSRTFPQGGVFFVNVTVTDDDGDAMTASARVDVPPNPNFKPFLAAGFAVVLAVVGILLYRRPGTHRNVLIVALASAAVEVAVGVASFLSGVLSVPPLLGPGLLVNVGITVAGCLAAWSLSRRTSPEAGPPTS